MSVGFVYLGASDENASARVFVGESVCMCVWIERRYSYSNSSRRVLGCGLFSNR